MDVDQRQTHALLNLPSLPSQIHVSKAASPPEDPKLSSQAKKLMHRFTVEEVLAKMDEAER
jgi:hypothetical protein